MRLLVTVGALFPLLTTAHHNTAALYDYNNHFEIEGEVTALLWRNPHSRFIVKVVREDGGTEEWELETNGPSILERRGVSTALLKVGDRIRVAGPVSRRGKNALYVVNVMLPNGEEIIFAPSLGEPRWTADATSIDPPNTIEAAASAESNDARGIFRVWTALRLPNSSDGSENLRFTEAALAAQAAFDPLTDDLTQQCIPPGMPANKGGITPVEFIDDGDDMILRMEEFDSVRMIHMSPDAGPISEPDTPMGYSVGYWEGNTLVVETTNISWPYFDKNGTPVSDDLQVSERITLRENDTRLDWEYTIVDPYTLLEPAVLTRHYAWVPGEQIKQFDCAKWSDVR
jgi:hypothetical protein